jgi:predicted ATPase
MEDNMLCFQREVPIETGRSGLDEMRLSYFKIENFRNISLAECDNIPNLMVICGGNGCGKSALLNAIMAAKENAAPYGGFAMDPRCVSSDAEMARVTLSIEFTELEQNWYYEKHSQVCPEKDEIVLEIQKGGSARVPKRSQVVRSLLSWYSREFKDSPGFFDYIDAHRIVAKKQLSTWNSSSLSDEKSKQSLGAQGTQKFNLMKEYLASLVMKDAQQILAAKRNGYDCSPDSLKDIREFFDGFFRPMRFKDVQIDTSPFKYIIETPKGEIDIDDLSSGEKEILNTFIHFHQLNPENAVILFDEVDAHLHPDLERRYLYLFKRMAENNQIILTTHSPEIMVAAGSSSLFALSKVQGIEGANQLSRVTADDELHMALSEIMGSNGMVSLNRKVVFLEGTESSSDRYIFEALYPPSEYNVSFIPVGDSSTNTSIAHRVNKLLGSAGTFQEFYSIIDADIERKDGSGVGDRLYKLPVYHVENFLIDTRSILKVTQEMLLERCPYKTLEDVDGELKKMLKEEGHLLPYTKAIFDAAVARRAKEAWDCVYKKDASGLSSLTFPVFDDIKELARSRLDDSIANDTWKSVCKGRDLLKAYCARHGFKYVHFRNLLIAKMDDLPEGLQSIIEKILGNETVET